MDNSLWKVKRLYFTLFELLIVIAILLVIAGVMTISIQKALVDQRFRSEVGVVVDDLRLAQQCMLIFPAADITMVVKEKSDGKGITYRLESDTTLPQPIGKVLINRDKDLKVIHGFFFDDEHATTTTEGRIDIRFLSNGFVMSKGIITLSTSDQEVPEGAALQAYIVLPGFPYPIRSVDGQEEADKIYDAIEDSDFDLMWTKEMIALLPEKFREYMSKLSEEKPEESSPGTNQQDPAKKSSSQQRRPPAKAIEKRKQTL